MMIRTLLIRTAAFAALGASLLVAQNKPQGAPAAAKSAKPQTFTGRVSDAKCGVNVDADCNQRCFQSGQAPVLVLDGSNEVLSTVKGDELKKYPGGHVQVAGTRAGDVLTVSKVKPLAE